jgi:orotate phosphoribosyltransferase
LLKPPLKPIKKASSIKWGLFNLYRICFIKSTDSWNWRLNLIAENPALPDLGRVAGERKIILNMKQELIDILCRKSFKYSNEPTFKLVSGNLSRFYVNCKPTTLSARGMFLAGHLLFDKIKDSDVSGVGGLTFGADPLAVAAAFASEMKGQAIDAFSIRKTQKDHGIVRWVEGDVQPGQRVVIIDDVATTGGSTIKAIERARAEDLEVVKSVILVDRQEGGLENIGRNVDEVCSIIKRDELIERWKELGLTND